MWGCSCRSTPALLQPDLLHCSARCPVCHATVTMLGQSRRRRCHLAHDFCKAHGFIDARDGSCQVCQKGALIIASCQPGILRVRVHFLSATRAIFRLCSREVALSSGLLGIR